jgi:membrane protein required for colicin V production
MIFDAVVIFVLLFSSAIAFLRGFIREMLMILGLIIGLVAAWYFGPGMAPTMVNMLGEKGHSEYRFFGILHGDIVAQMLGYAAVFFPILIAASVASYFLSTGAKAMGLGPVDRTLGVVFGIARALVLISLLYMPFYLWTEKEDRDKFALLQDSHTRVIVEGVSGWMVTMVPEDMLASVKKDADRAKDEAAKTARQKLQEMDVLRRDGKQRDNDVITPMPEPQPAAGPSPGPGYEDNQRRDMGKLIGKGMNE